MLERRQFTLGLLGAGVLAGTGCSPKGAAPSGQIDKVGIQTYTLRFALEEDPRATYQMIKDVGYDYVELNDRNFRQIPAVELKAMLDDIGLPSPASHTPMALLSGDRTELLDICRTLDLKYVVLPWVDADKRTYEDWKAHAALLNEAGRELADNGIKLAYHNHQFEFEDLGNGTTAMDVLLGDCPPENLCFEIDLFWAALADADIPQLFKDHPGRFKLCHIKDMAPNKADFVGASYEQIGTDLMKNVGEGALPFETYFALNAVSGMEYFVAEHDQPPKPFKNSIETSLKAVRGFRF